MAHRGFAPGRRYLISAAYASTTLTKYNDAVESFLVWTEALDYDPLSSSDYDDLITDYLHHLYETNQGKGKAHATLFGILHHQPEFKGKLPLAAMTLRGWNKLQPGVSYPPLTWEITCLIANALSFRGHFRAAVATVLAFDCFLRISEFLGLRREDVADARDARIGVAGVDMTIRLRSTKTGPNQWVVVQDPQVKRLVRLVVSSTRPGRFLFPLSTHVFRRLFKQACSWLHLSPATSHTRSAMEGRLALICWALRWRTSSLVVAGLLRSPVGGTSRVAVPFS
jgi:hypothetical protein